MLYKYRKALDMIEETADWLNETRYACGFGDDERQCAAMIAYAINEGARRLQSIEYYLLTGDVPKWYEREKEVEDVDMDEIDVEDYIQAHEA